MKECVIISKQDWDELPLLIAEALERHSRRGYGFKVVNREDNREVEDRLVEFFAGTMGMIWADVTRTLGDK